MTVALKAQMLSSKSSHRSARLSGTNIPNSLSMHKLHRPQTIVNLHRPVSVRASSFDAASSSTRPSAIRQAPPTPARWIGFPSRPGPNNEDGEEYFDVFGSGKVLHVAATIVFAVSFIAAAIAFRSDPRWQLIGWLATVGPLLLAEGVTHQLTDKWHGIHAITGPIYLIFTAAFFYLGGLGPVLSGPRDALFRIFIMGVIFGGIGVPFTVLFMTFFRLPKDGTTAQ